MSARTHRCGSVIFNGTQSLTSVVSFVWTQDVFECAQAEYVDEGVPWSMIAYKDNKELLELFEGKLGILGLLNEECMLPKVRNTS